MAYSDGTFTSVKQDGPTRVTYPFINSQTKDTTTKQYEANYLILPGSYTPASALATWPGDGGLIASDAAAYLVEESEPEVTGGAYRIKRRYSKIPGTQTEYTSRWFNRPNMSGFKSGSTYAASYDAGLTTHLHTSRKTVLATSTTAGGTVSATLPSTNITCTDTDGHTAVFAANASVATVLTQLANLTNLLGFSAATDGTTLAFYWRNTSGKAMVSITAAAATVDVAWANGSARITAYGNTITPDLTLINCPSHGGSIGEKCGLWNNDTLVHTGSVTGVSSGDALSVLVSEQTSPDLSITHMTFAAAAAFRYPNGPKMVRVKQVKEFYLPTVTGGITTYADIPVVTTYTSGQAWLDQIVASATYVAIDSGNVEQWEGPIYVRETVSCLMTSALESIAKT